MTTYDKLYILLLFAIAAVFSGWYFGSWLAALYGAMLLGMIWGLLAGAVFLAYWLAIHAFKEFD